MYDEGTEEKISNNIKTISDTIKNMHRDLDSIGNILGQRHITNLVGYEFNILYHHLNEIDRN